jgi:3-hydroxyisobutyrate dehydrogenase/2-hydroxy-3-oxopropionate reductase
MTRIAVIGAGGMGGLVARRLLDAGHDVTVWNRTAAKAAPLAEAGATVAESPAAASREAEAVLIMVADPQALEEVAEGPDGIASGASPSTTVIQMSTVGPDAVSRFAAALPEGVRLLDAPVLGSLPEAEAGTLRIFAGGPAALVERWTPLLSVLGTVLHVGPVGAGSAAKLVANSTLFGALGVLGEALALADAVDLPREVAYDVLAASPLAAQAERRRPAVESGDYPTRFTLSLALKDAELIRAAATASGAELRVIEAARSWLADAAQGGLGDEDYAAVLSWIIGSRPRY